MGAKHSKKGGVSHSWHNKGEPFLAAEAFDVDELSSSAFRVSDLEQSRAGDRIHNSLGLPDDVIALIATYIDVRDLGRVAQVCKTWRRVSLSSAVWRYFAQDLGLPLQSSQDYRTAVVRAVSSSMSAAFCLAPPDEPPLDESVAVVKVAVMCPCANEPRSDCANRRLQLAFFLTCFGRRQLRFILRCGITNRLV